MKYQFSSTQEFVKYLNENLVSAAEAAEILGVTPRRVTSLVNEGKLDPVKDQPKMFLRDVVVEKKKELEELRKKYRPYDD